ncbi:hypothetical protein CGCSCA1_v004312 [Colletotrichum siamense]|nr:hypothetical protein CGCSCA1_v004312 [Colletotrichum siamense]
MHAKIVLTALFAAMAMANPAVLQSDSSEHPKLVGRPKGNNPGSGASCCSSTPGVCQPSCVSHSSLSRKVLSHKC